MADVYIISSPGSVLFTESIKMSLLSDPSMVAKSGSLHATFELTDKFEEFFCSSAEQTLSVLTEIEGLESVDPSDEDQLDGWHIEHFRSKNLLGKNYIFHLMDVPLEHAKEYYRQLCSQTPGQDFEERWMDIVFEKNIEYLNAVQHAIAECMSVKPSVLYEEVPLSLMPGFLYGGEISTEIDLAEGFSKIRSSMFNRNFPEQTNKRKPDRFVVECEDKIIFDYFSGTYSNLVECTSAICIIGNQVAADPQNLLLAFEGHSYMDYIYLTREPKYVHRLVDVVGGENVYLDMIPNIGMNKK